MKKLFLLLILLSFLFTSCQNKSDEIIIGGAISLTGDNSMQGNRGLNGMLLAIDIANEQGGINGKTIRFVSEDTQTSAKGAITAYTKLAQIDKADAIITTGDVEFQAINDITNKSKKVTLATICSGMLEKNRSPYLFRYCFNEKIQDAILMDFIKKHMNENEVTLLYPNSLWGKEIEEYNDLGANKTGIIIEHKETYDPNSLDQKAVALKVNENNPKIVCARGFGSGFEATLKHLSELGFKGVIVGDITISLPGTINNTKGITEGAYFVSVDLKDSSDSFTEMYKKKYYEKYSEEPSVWDALGFDTCSYLIAALRFANENDVTLEEALRSVKDVQLLLGDNKFGSSNDVDFKMSVFKVTKGNVILVK